MAQPAKKRIPRGIRNNNPLNIRKSPNKWKGKIVPSSDPDFEQFETVELGLRAAFCILRTYINKYHYYSVHSIISRWAPRSENNTDKYIQDVALSMRVSAYDILSFSNMVQMTTLVWAMCKIECGADHGIEFNRFIKAYEMV